MDTVKLTIEDFIKLRDLIHDKTGLYFETNKVYYVGKRLEKRMEIMKIKDPADYLLYLKFKDKSDCELQNFLNALTTNETYFYREEKQLEAFVHECLPEILHIKRKRGDMRLKIWSAGCSTGEEPYTLAILLREHIPDLALWQVEITATDIDTEVLEKAKKARYPDRSLRFLPHFLAQKYFVREGQEYRVSPVIANMASFSRLNLMDRHRMRIMRDFDFLFCRNVLIYFDDNSRKAVMAHFYDSLKPGGYIYLGHSESVTRISSAFNIKRAGGLIVHQKPGLQEV